MTHSVPVCKLLFSMLPILLGWGIILQCDLPLVAQSVPSHLEGKVVGVLDGDSLEILVDKKPLMVRLHAIDAPEWDQARGKDAKKALSQLAFGKQAVVEVKGLDNNERTLGRVNIGKVELNAEMLERGWAWHFKRFDQDEKLAKLETEARKAKRGLWADKKPEPPWEYRDRKKVAEAGPKTKPADEGNEKYWLNLGSNVRHNSSCEHYQKARNGRACTKDEGKACGICGG